MTTVPVSPMTAWVLRSVVAFVGIPSTAVERKVLLSASLTVLCGVAWANDAPDSSPTVRALPIIKKAIGILYAGQKEHLKIPPDRERIQALKEQLEDCRVELKPFLKDEDPEILSQLLCWDRRAAFTKAWKRVCSLYDGTAHIVQVSTFPVVRPDKEFEYYASGVIGVRT